MEPDLTTLIGTCQVGDRFPQFRESWDGIHADAIALAGRLKGEPAQVRRRIALRGSNPESLCTLFFAFSDRETDLFWFNPNWSESEYRRALKTAEPHWILGDRKEGGFEVVAGSKKAGSDDFEGQGLRVMIPTGGTSGKIRFAIHDSNTLLASAKAFLSFFGVDRVSSLCVLPLYHVSGFMQLIRAVASKGEVVFGSVSDFAASHAWLDSLQSSSRFLSLVPTQLQRMVKSEPSHIDLLKSYRAILVGGGPLNEELADLSRSLKLPLAPTYGMTETASMVATLKPEAFLAGKGGQGFPLPHAEIAIVRDSNRPISRGAEGRIKVKSAALFSGYYGQSKRAGDAFETSDGGMLSPQGELTVLGRRDRVIISGGEKIDLEEVEKTLRNTGLVAEVFAFGIEDSDWGNALCLAYCPVSANVDETELKSVVSDSLASYKHPKNWLRLAAIPRNASGKVSVEALRALVDNH